MVDIEFETIDSRVVVRFKREYKSETLQRSYMTNELIIVVQKPHLEDIKADFAVYSNLAEAEQVEFLKRLRALPKYIERLLLAPSAIEKV